MIMAVKNRFGVNMKIFAFLLFSLYSAMAVDMSSVSYTRVNARYLEWELENHINQAISQGQYFYIGVTCTSNHRITTTIQALCKRHGDSTTLANADRCVRPHPKDTDVEVHNCGIEIAKVFYSNAFKTKTQVYEIEKRLIAKFFKTCTVEPLCLNRKVGEDQCGEERGIVYLRIYEKAESLPYFPGRPRKWRRTHA